MTTTYRPNGQPSRFTRWYRQVNKGLTSRERAPIDRESARILYDARFSPREAVAVLA